MHLFDLLIMFDAALDWPLDDPFLADDDTPVRSWAPQCTTAIEGAA